MVAVVLVLIGVQQQHARRITDVSAVSISVDGRHRPLVRLGRAPAQILAQRVNALGRFPSGEISCGGENLPPLVLRFASREGAIEVDRSRDGCEGVEVFSHGRSWGTDKWDPAGNLLNTINRYLPVPKH